MRRIVLLLVAVIAVADILAFTFTASGRADEKPHRLLTLANTTDVIRTWHSRARDLEHV